ncbi:MAG: glycosyltransferase family 39 protein, partial [Chloroflexota bacterium]
MSNDPNRRDQTNREGRSAYRRLALLLAAATVIVFGVFAQNLLVVAIGLLLAVAAFYLLPEATPIPIIPGYAFLAGGAVLLAGFATLLTYREINNPFIPLLWVGSMVVGLVAVIRLDRTLPQTAEGSRRSGGTLRSRAWLILIILVAFALRIHLLETYPPFHGDEGEMGMAALRVLAGEGPPPVATGWFDHPALFHYLQALPLALFGQTGLALRLPSVFAGLLCVPLIYVIGRRWWGPLAGLSAASLLAVAHLHVHFSRLGLNNIESTLFLLLFLFLMLRARPQRVTVYFLAGLAAGLAQYMYYGSRIILFVAAFFLLLVWRRRLAGKRQLAIFAIGVALAILPLLAFYINRPDPLISRTRGVFVLSGDNVKHVLHSDEASLPEDLLPMFAQQIRSNLSFFIADGDRSPFYTAEVPGLDMVTSVLFWLGLGLALTRLPRLQESTVL